MNSTTKYLCVSKDKRHPISEWALKMNTNSISEKKEEEKGVKE
jgi:hypothetical protein